ncbi:MAG: hypothetical protein ACRES7_10250 [Gammaproteobacteria bacterium]
MEVTKILEGMIASLLAAGVIAGVAWLYSWCRNMLLERALKQAINPNGVGVEFRLHPLHAEFTLQIHNYANATIRVRTVIFVSEHWHIVLDPDPQKRLFQTPLNNEATRKKFKRKRLSRGLLEPDNNPHSILLPSKTMAVWRVNPQTIGQREWVINDVFVVFEYATLFGNAAMIRVKVGENPLKLIKHNFERLSRAAHLKKPFDEPYEFVAEA